MIIFQVGLEGNCLLSANELDVQVAERSSSTLLHMVFFRGFTFIHRYIHVILLLALLLTFVLWTRESIDCKGTEIAEVSVAVVTVLKDLSNIEEYQLAMKSFECYCIYQRYQWTVIDVSRNDTLGLLCPQNEFFFQRHCVVAQFMHENSNFNYVLFVDSDMGVINPKRRIEEYIMAGKDIIFYNRIWNFEVMAGSYLAK
ncbi:unnamed protein product [Litomosoides sigmodontis]|uniref:Nucleotide-diphospho-sugar transferase domain-containing protein n=1 Tax=Litomosoides sigmodontis TaxID=42156 RepID=A0A3P7JQH8_LITSI|nr:unnamed protein product [Litomosoides sigmodontis]